MALVPLWGAPRRWTSCVGFFITRNGLQPTSYGLQVLAGYLFSKQFTVGVLSLEKRDWPVSSCALQNCVRVLSFCCSPSVLWPCLRTLCPPLVPQPKQFQKEMAGHDSSGRTALRCPCPGIVRVCLAAAPPPCPALSKSFPGPSVLLALLVLLVCVVQRSNLISSYPRIFSLLVSLCFAHVEFEELTHKNKAETGWGRCWHNLNDSTLIVARCWRRMLG